jgi:hypothetical protein
MSDLKPLKLNFNADKSLKSAKTYVNSCLILTLDQSANITSKGYCIGKYLDVITLELDPQYTYKIMGGSTISGAPARKYVNSFNPILERVPGRKSSLRVHSKFIGLDWSVLDIKVAQKI